MSVRDAQRLYHALVADLTRSYEAFELPVDRGQTIVTYTAAPGSVTDVDRVGALHAVRPHRLVLVLSCTATRR